MPPRGPSCLITDSTVLRVSDSAAERCTHILRGSDGLKQTTAGSWGLLAVVSWVMQCVGRMKTDAIRRTIARKALREIAVGLIRCIRRYCSLTPILLRTFLVRVLALLLYLAITSCTAAEAATSRPSIIT